MAQMQLVGRLGRDAEKKETKNGNTVVSFSIADSIYADGERKTQWIKVSIFGKRAEGVYPYLKKGTTVFAVGEFIAREYANKQGEVKTSLELNATNGVQLCGSKQDAQEGASDANYAPPAPKKHAPAPVQDIDDDIPF